MSQFSETIGSFTRTGNYPLEAYYIFESELELKDFYNDELNKTTLHKGLLKIVSLRDQLILYWVVEEEGELVFKPLISTDSFDDLLQLLKELQTEFIDTTNDIYERIRKIIGTDNYSDFQEGLDNLLVISDTLIEIRNAVEENKKELQALVGTEDPIISTLEGLPYKNFIEVVEILRRFFGDEVLDDFNTLKKILDIIYKISSECRYNNANLWEELNNTLNGVGLDSNGLYSPDTDTYYLKTSTSVMNSLRILDKLIHKINYTFQLSNTAYIEAIDGESSTILIPHVKISEESDIKETESGLYYKLESEYTNGILTLKVNDEVKYTHNIGLSSIILSSSYNSGTETIIIVFKLHNGETETLEIPVSDIIEEWATENSDTIKLTRTRNIEGTDSLKADLKVSSEDNNMLTIESDGVYVEGTTDNIKYRNGTLTEHLDNLESLESLELGETSGTAYPGDKGAALNNHFNDLIEHKPLCNFTINGATFPRATQSGNLVGIEFATYNPNMGNYDQVSLYLPEATADNPGLINAEQYKTLVAANKASRANFVVWGNTGIGISPTTVSAFSDYVDITLRTIDSNGNSSNRTLTLPAATAEKAGVMSVEDKWNIEAIQTLKESYYVGTGWGDELLITENSDGTRDILLVGRNYEGNESGLSVPIPLATPEYDGFMSKEDKAKLDSINISDIGGGNLTDEQVEDLAKIKEFENINILYCGDDTHPTFSRDSNGVLSLQYPVKNIYGGDTSLFKMDVPVADSDASGIMSVEDKVNLNTLKSFVSSKNFCYHNTDNPIQIVANLNNTGKCHLVTPYINIYGAKSSSVIEIPEVSSTSNGLMSIADKTKLDSIDTAKLITTDRLYSQDEQYFTNVRTFGNSESYTLTFETHYLPVKAYPSLEKVILLPRASHSLAGLMVASDKTLLDNINTILTSGILKIPLLVPSGMGISFEQTNTSPEDADDSSHGELQLLIEGYKIVNDAVETGYTTQTVPVATARNNGAMSAVDKRLLTNVETILTEPIESSANSFLDNPSGANASISFTSYMLDDVGEISEKEIYMYIPYASSTTVGLMTPTLINSIKDSSAQIAVLETKIAQLEARIAALEGN